MREILQLLVESNDHQCLSFDESKEKIAYLTEIQPLHVINEISQAIWNGEASDSLLFFCFVTLKCCFVSTTKKLHGTIFFETSLSNQIIDELLCMLKGFFSHTYDPVRKAATHLFSMICDTQLYRFPALGIIPDLVLLLNQKNQPEVILSASECLLHIISKFEIEYELQLRLFMSMSVLIEHYNDNDRIVGQMILLLSNCPSLVTKEIQNSDHMVSIINNILGKIDNAFLKDKIYSFLTSLIEIDFYIYEILSESIITHSYKDLTECKNRDVLLSVSYLWEIIFFKSEEDFFNGNGVNMIIESLFFLMESIDTKEVNQILEWEPFNSSFSAIRCFCQKYPIEGLEVLNEYIGQASLQTHENIKEVQLKCIMMYLENADCSEELDYINDIIKNGIQNDSLRVKYYSIECLKILISKYPKECDYYASLFPDLFLLVQIDPAIAKEVLFAVFQVSRLPQFVHFDFLEMNLEEMISILSHNSSVLYTLECFGCFGFHNVPNDVCIKALAFLLSFIDFELRNNHDHEVIDYCIGAIKSILLHSQQRHLQMKNEINELFAPYLSFIMDFTDMMIPKSLVVLSLLYVLEPNVLNYDVSFLLEKAIIFLGMKDDAHQFEGIFAIALLSMFVDISQWTHSLIEKSTEFLSYHSSLSIIIEYSQLLIVLNEQGYGSSLDHYFHLIIKCCQNILCCIPGNEQIDRKEIINIFQNIFTLIHVYVEHKKLSTPEFTEIIKTMIMRHSSDENNMEILYVILGFCNQKFGIKIPDDCL